MAVSLFPSNPGAQVDRWRLDSRCLIWHFLLLHTVQLDNWLMTVGFTYRSWSKLNLLTSLKTKMNSKTGWASNLHSKQLANAHILWEQRKPRQKPHNFAQRFLLPSVLPKQPTELCWVPFRLSNPLFHNKLKEICMILLTFAQTEQHNQV